ncbi:GMC family oxidoreductase [Aspergillus stella-maris]|uniref:GMC family oxidoreductase n=1 Tax=Aspergillus stella-maris TaxID=1810926 RepID=UPI003CCDDEA8
MRLTCRITIGTLVLGLGLIAPASAGSQFKGHLIRDSSLLPTYDYVIVGGGVSGLTVANRLSEDADLSILVIEAGEFDKNEDSILIPGLAGGVIGTEYDWNLTYVSNPDAADRSVSIPQGKVVGGSSLLNRMVFDRGSSADYDRWRELGNEGLGWSDLLPYFKKSETFTAPNEDIVEEWNITYNLAAHGETGPIQSSWAPWIWPATKHFIDAITSFGVSIPLDAASGDAVGGYWSPHSQDPVTVTRSDARRAYYDSVSSRPNLHLVTGRKVTRLVSERSPTGPRITGAEIAVSATSGFSIINATKEVILAAGSLHTPQILQLSGIGDPALLKTLNISTVANVPGVGHNLQDHLYVPVVYQMDFPLTATNLTTNATFAAESLALYRSEKTGPYADATGNFLAFLPFSNFTGVAEVTALHETAQSQDPSAYLDADTPSTVTAGYTLQHNLLVQGIPSKHQAQLEIIWSDGTFVLGLQHPFSRGSVRLSSTDPFDAPLADPAFLRNPLDVEILIAAIKYARELASSPILSAYNPLELVPGSNVTTDEQLETYIRGAAESLYHPSGTCSVGRKERGGVVDTDFRVHGVQNLRVVDASVLPMLPATHIQSSVYAVAEKAAEAIKRSA